MNPTDLNEAHKLRSLVQATLDNVPESASERLAAVRRIAVQHKKPETSRRSVPVLSLAAGGAAHVSWSLRARRAGAVLPLLVGMGLFAGLYYTEDQQRIVDAADVDMAVLLDDLPLSAYLDDGFRAFVADGGE